MRTVLETEECGGFVRCMPVRNMDDSTLLRARERFRDYRKRGVICNGNFEDDVWTLTNELRKYAMDFRFDGSLFRLKAMSWAGCAEECYRECMKAFISLQLGSYSLPYLQVTLRKIKLIAGMEKEEAKAFANRGHVYIAGFFLFLPEDNDLKDEIIEAMEERKWTIFASGPRQLANFQSYLRFNKELDDFWKLAASGQKRFYFPVYFWWKLTSILPLRVTEFLVTPRDCLRQKDGGYLLSVRRTKLKKGGRKKLSYKVESDFLLQSYEIPEWLFREIKNYLSVTEGENHLPELGTLLIPDKHTPSGYFSYHCFSNRLKQFCAEILGDSDYPIHIGDTRHLAMINLMLSGGSPVICRELAGHESVKVSANYYANLSSIIESVVYERYHGWMRGLPLEGSLRFPVALPVEKIRTDSGWCDVPRVAKGDVSECLKCRGQDGRIGECVDCPHFYPDSPGLRIKLERGSKAAVDEDGEYLMQMIELVRKGLGYEEDIAAALLRLQNSGYRYGTLLSQKCLEDAKNGQT